MHSKRSPQQPRRNLVQWTLISEEGGRCGRDNMSIDYGMMLAAQQGAGYLRLYRWTPPCLSFGRNEPAATRYDVDEIRRLGLDTVRRPTGGRAVWHDGELTYAVVAPQATFGSLRETYLAIHELLAAALQRLGIPAAIAPRSSSRAPRPDAGACFAAPIGGEIVVADRKLVGSAQLRERDTFLQHGSILLDHGQDVVTRVTRGSVPPIRATSLRDVLRRPVAHHEVVAAIADEAQRAWPGTWIRAARSPDVDVSDKFGHSSWTWRR